MRAAVPLCRAACNGKTFQTGRFLLIFDRVGFPSLVSAISEAGGLGDLLSFQVFFSTFNFPPGILTALSQPSPEALRQAIRETRKLTSKPFGVNITILPTINPPDYDGFTRAAVEEGVKIFETAGNNRLCPFFFWRRFKWPDELCSCPSDSIFETE